MKNIYTMIGAGLLFLTWSCQTLEDADQITESDEYLALTNPSPPPQYLPWYVNEVDVPAPGSEGIRYPWDISGQYEEYFDFIHDYRPEDGWELYYNMFSETTVYPQRYFILYNRLRGILRMYYYGEAGAIPSNQIVHRLRNTKNGSTLLNFEGQNVVDLDDPVSVVSSIEPITFQNEQFLIYEWEMAYDPLLKFDSFSSANLNFNMNSINQAQINLNGSAVSQGDIKGKISVPGVDLTIGSINVNNNSTILNIKGDKGKESLIGKLSAPFIDGVSQGITKGISGVVGNFVSSIFGKITGSSGTSDAMAIKMNTTSQMSGTLTDQVGLGGTIIHLSDYNPWPSFPSYNKPLGVFTLSNKPTVNSVKNIYERVNEWGQAIPPTVNLSYTINQNSFSFVPNNEALNGFATISDLKYELVVNGSGAGTFVHGTQEMIDGGPKAVGSTVTYNNNNGDDSGFISILGIRVSFKVNPTGGGNSVLITKTFAVNENAQVIYHPPSGGGADS